MVREKLCLLFYHDCFTCKFEYTEFLKSDLLYIKSNSLSMPRLGQTELSFLPSKIS